MRFITFGALLFLTTLQCGCSLIQGRSAATSEIVAIGACNPVPCAKITLNTLPPLPASFSTAARTAIQERVEQALYAPLDDTDEEPTRKRFIESVQTQFNDFLEVKDPETVVDWQVLRSASIVFAHNDFASIAVTNEGYLGGAHGFSDEQIFVFDATSGRVLSWDDVLSPESKPVFLRAAEAEFRRARDIKPTQTLEEAGFTFENGLFELPANFAITDKGIRLHYNPYEVGPYVLGPTDCMVPIDVAGPALNNDVIHLERKEHASGLL